MTDRMASPRQMFALPGICCSLNSVEIDTAAATSKCRARSMRSRAENQQRRKFFLGSYLVVDLYGLLQLFVAVAVDHLATL